MPSFYLWTIGCQMNRADSFNLAEELLGRGFEETPTADGADLIVLNSCVVRQSAETRVTNKLSALKALKRRRPGTCIALMGCMVDSNLAELRRRFPQVDIFVSAGRIDVVAEWANQWAPVVPPAEVHLPVPVSAFVTIIEGCDQFCSYCIVPYRRGRERSLSIAEVCCQVERLAARGVKEVTLLGQNVGAYGRDLPEEPALADLLAEVHQVRGIQRIRFLTFHPKDMTERTIQAVAGLPRVCECFSLPLQSGDDEVLRRMGRGYTAAQYRDVVAGLREAIPGVAISSDVIVGFPGETEAQFERTAQLVAELRFDTLHVAAYSERPGTIAARTMADTVPPEEKRRRREHLEALQEAVATEINAALLGATVDVLVEDKVKGRWRGRTRGGKLVFFDDPGSWRGHTVPVVIERTSPWSLQGRFDGPVRKLPALPTIISGFKAADLWS